MKTLELFAFDLDGTLLDTAPDFLYAVNILRERYQFDEADYNQVRSRVSQGAASLASYALDLEGESAQKVEFHRQELLDIYENCCLTYTEIFDGIEEILTKLNNKQIKWGIITNKPRRFAENIVEFLDLIDLIDLIVKMNQTKMVPTECNVFHAIQVHIYLNQINQVAIHVLINVVFVKKECTAQVVGQATAPNAA
mgnify:CR=1 FL=1